MTNSAQKSSAAAILVAWLVVGIPLGWGVYNTLLSSMKIVPAPGLDCARGRSSKIIA
jgi:hypothetical protein